MSLTNRILAAMVVGILVGSLLNALGHSAALPDSLRVFIEQGLVGGLFDAVGRIFIASLKLLVVPLVLVSLICGASSLGDSARMGPIAIKTLGLYLATTAIAVTLALLFAIGRKVLKDNPAYPQAGPVFDLVLATTTVWVLTSELLQWLDLAGVSDSYKLWVSILWGVYALALIGLGIWKKKRHLRIAAIALFSLTLVKLFVYDIAHLNTLSKTLVFVSLGVILLIVSFLYNRYKQSISGED